MVFLKALREGCFPVSSNFWWLPAILSIPWLVITSLQSLLLRSHGILPVCLCLHFSSLLRISVIRLGLLESSMLSSELDCIYKHPISKQGHICRYWGLGLQHLIPSPWCHLKENMPEVLLIFTHNDINNSYILKIWLGKNCKTPTI